MRRNRIVITRSTRSDNGPPFNGHEFETFANHLGFKHTRKTPYWPKANGEAERLVKTLVKIIFKVLFSSTDGRLRNTVLLRTFP